MKAVAFAGPSLHGEHRDLPPGIDKRPPAGQGDVYRAVCAGYDVIAIIDGYFEGVPSVWHKEVLYALEQGVAVYGASSMGALRAAELDAFGMIGVGEIYAWYRDGIVMDDAEVALVHGPEEAGFVPLSEPLVNVRATLKHAEAAGRLRREDACRLLDAAQRLHYADRTLEEVAVAAGLPGCSATLLDMRIDLKKRDALALLSVIADPAVIHTAPPASFRLERTIFWEAAVRSWETVDTEVRTVLDQLRVSDPQWFSSLRQAALATILLRREANARSLRAAPADLKSAARQFRLARGLTTQAALNAWLDENRMDGDRMNALLADQVACRAAARALQGPQLDSVMVDLLKASDRYAALLQQGLSRPAVAGDRAYPAPPPVLLQWFASRWTGGLPGDVDSIVEALALDSRDELYSLLARAYLSSLERNGD